LRRTRPTQNCGADDDDDDKAIVKLSPVYFNICLFGNKSRMTKPESIMLFLNLICS
jgi:hypothetical protein